MPKYHVLDGKCVCVCVCIIEAYEGWYNILYKLDIQQILTYIHFMRWNTESESVLSINLLQYIRARESVYVYYIQVQIGILCYLYAYILFVLRHFRQFIASVVLNRAQYKLVTLQCVYIVRWARSGHMKKYNIILMKQKYNLHREFTYEEQVPTYIGILESN